jgi:hypothetical protein
MTQEVYASLIGILYTDGCVSPKGGSWRVIVSNNSQAVVDRYETAIESCFQKSVRRSMRGQLHVGVLDSKEIGQFLIEQHGTFRTEACSAHQGCPFLRGGRKPCRRCEPILHNGIQYPPASLPDFASDGEVAAFLQTAFSCDGGVNLYVARRGVTKWLIRNVYLACKHPVLIFQYAALLVRLGIKCRVILGDWRVLVQGYEMIDRFARLINFLHGSVIGANSSFWHRRTKSKVLDMLLESYGNPRSIYDLPQFSTENLG